MQRTNVREQIRLTDTILVSKFVGRMTSRPQGWFASFADLGAAGELSFFNVRNRSIGLMYNNQDARDQLPYGMRVQSIGVRFYGATVSTFTGCQNVGSTEVARSPIEDTVYTDPVFGDLINREELHSGVWEADLPNHCSAILRTNQDDRLRAPVAMLASGTGPVGGGWGWGSPATLLETEGSPVLSISKESTSINFGSYEANVQTIEHGNTDVRLGKGRFPFPIPIEIPRRANVSLVIKLSQYAREMMQAIHGPYWWPIESALNVSGGADKLTKAACFGIECTMVGERLVQQRGDYSV